MRRTLVEYFCDVCGEKVETPDSLKSIKYPVIFHTEQEEGRTVEPYISHKTVEMCECCMKSVLRIHAWGARGDYDYRIVDPGIEV